jgi:hypothetical protein
LLIRPLKMAGKKRKRLARIIHESHQSTAQAREKNRKRKKITHKSEKTAFPCLPFWPVFHAIMCLWQPHHAADDPIANHIGDDFETPE